MPQVTQIAHFPAFLPAQTDTCFSPLDTGLRNNEPRAQSFVLWTLGSSIRA